MTCKLLLAALTCAVTAAFPVQASPRTDAAAFVRHLYDRYRSTDKVASPTGADAPEIFDPTLLALIRRDQAEAKGETGRLDHDPICDCQDSGGLTGLEVTAAESGGRATTAIARFTISADKVEVRYKLALTQTGWRITDLGTPSNPSLRKFLSPK